MIMIQDFLYTNMGIDTNIFDLYLGAVILAIIVGAFIIRSKR